MIRIICLLLFFSGYLATDSQAQQRFKAGAVVGVNASQIDGDNYAGYDKLGLEGGIRVAAILADKSDVSLEMLFSQRGSQSQFFNGNSNFPFKLNLNYVSVPIQFNYKDWLFETDDGDSYYKVNIAAGLTLARLISSRVDDELADPLAELVPFFNKNELAINLGATFYANKSIGFGIRWTRAITVLFERDNTSPNARSLVGKFVTFRVLYML